MLISGVQHDSLFVYIILSLNLCFVGEVQWVDEVSRGDPHNTPVPVPRLPIVIPCLQCAMNTEFQGTPMPGNPARLKAVRK